MLKRTEVRALALVLGAATVVACSDTATAPDAQASASDVLFAKGSNGGGGGGKPDGGGKGAATTLGDFRVFASGVTASRTTGEGEDVPLLVDGEDKVSITLTNRLDVSTWNGNSRQETRQGFAFQLCTDMSKLTSLKFVDDPDSELDDDDEGDYVTAGGVVGGILCSKSRMHTRNESIDLDLLTVDGAIAHAGGKIVPRELDSNGAWDWRIIFDTSSLGPEGDEAPEIGNGLCVERTSTNTWRFFNGCTGVDLDVELWRFNDGDPRMVAEFDMPFSFTVTSG